MDTECSKSADVSHAICIMKAITSVLSAFMTKRIQLRRHDKAYPMKASWDDFKLVNTFPLVNILSTTLEHIPFKVFGAQGQWLFNQWLIIAKTPEYFFWYKNDATRRAEITTQTMTCPLRLRMSETQAIINATSVINDSCRLFTLWTSHASHHHGLVNSKFQTRNSSSILQQWSCEVWSCSI